jgi:hypothetical protein
MLAQPGIEIVGAYAWSADKVGKDLGELCNLPSLGIAATGDIEEILALKPDVVLYMPLLWDVDHMVLLLEAGINVVATSNFITGRGYAAGSQERIRSAAERGGATIYGSGINPGHASAMALTAAAASREVEYVGIHEAADCTEYQSADTWRGLGFGSPLGTPGLEEAAKERQRVFQEVVETVAEALGVTLDEVRFRLDFGVATKNLDLGYMEIAEGMICGVKSVWQGVVGGKVFVETSAVWRLGDAIEPDWPTHNGHEIVIRGRPGVRLMQYYEHIADPDDYNAITANPAINAIPAVVAARPGIVTVSELPLITAGSVKLG